MRLVRRSPRSERRSGGRPVGDRPQPGFHRFDGNWAQAASVSTGYGASEILDRVLAASAAVEAGEVGHERDSVTFGRIDYSWPVLAALLWSGVLNSGDLRVIDIGGSLGTTLRQNRKFLSPIPRLKWAIVEQPNFVAAGRENFETNVLTFHATIESAASIDPNVALAGSSLQYLEEPAVALAKLSQTRAEVLILDRTPVHLGESDILTIQSVPQSIYPATYPAWLFAKGPMIERLEALGWCLVEEFKAPEAPSTTSSGDDFLWVGFILAREIH